MTMKFRNEASGTTSPEARSGIVRGPHGNNYSAVLLDSPADPLPAPARERLTALRDRYDDAAAIARNLTDKKVELISEKQRWTARINQLSGDDGYTQPVGENHPSMREARAQLERAERELGSRLIKSTRL